LVNKKISVAVIVAVILVAAGFGAYYATLPTTTPQSTTTGAMSSTGAMSTTAAAGPIKIGFFAPLTGFAAADGYSSLHGALLAVSDLNDKGGLMGRQVELVYYDDGLSADQAIAVVTKMIEEDKVSFVISGSYTGTTLAVAPIVEKYQIPMIAAYAVHPSITANKTWIFRVGLMGQTEGRAAGYAAVKLFNASNIAILYDDIPFGVTLAGNAKLQAEQMGGHVLFYDKFDDAETDFRPWLTKIAAIPDLGALIFLGYYYHANAIIQARQLGIKAQIIGAEGFDSPQLIDLAGDSANGVAWVSDLDRSSSSVMTQTFLTSYKAHTGITADMVGASTYDAVMVAAQAISTAGSLDPTSIRNALLGLQNFQGVTGEILQFTPGHNAIKPMSIQIVKNKQFTSYATITDPAIITPPS
jgi:branched-chain amino acid transport system substrate-binding protein